MQFLGGIIVNIDVSKMKELIVSNIKDSRETLTIVDNRNNILFSSNEKNMMKKIDKVDFYSDIKFREADGYQIIHDGNQEILVTVASSNKFNWKYISTVPLNAYEEYNKSTRGFYFKLFLACIIISIVASFFIALYCYTPVKNILNLLKHPDIYEKSYSVDIGLRKDETHEIALNIVRNLYSNKQMQAEMKSYTDIINKAQLTALQAQISPHFLYNTLENIRWRAMEICKGDNEVSKIILNLSEMLRISLESDQQLVSIEEEIKNTKLYINILQLRYEDKLQVLWEVNEIAVSYPIVKVSLQPIIENAVYHGIKPLRKLGVITIVVDKQEDKIVIRIKDNGVGMSNEMVKRLNKDMKEKYILQEDHIGIRNVNQRIKLLMGDDAGLEIQSEENAGTTVTVILPIPKLTEGLKGVKEYEI
jgi:two-component system sensor histidine kinase YesM